MKLHSHDLKPPLGGGWWGLPHTSFQCDLQQLLCFHGKFHGQFVEHFLGISIHYQPNGCFGVNAALIAVEYLVFAYFRSGGFVFHNGRIVIDVHIRKSVCSAFITKQQTVAL